MNYPCIYILFLHYWMGQTLSQPITSKAIQRYGDEYQRVVGSSEMQGYRCSMEDGNSIKLNLKDGISFYGIYDGHCGDGAAKYCAEQLYQRISKLKDPTNASLIKKCVVRMDQNFISSKCYENIREQGSTACFAIVKPIVVEVDKRRFGITIGNVGDSCALLVRSDGTFTSLTTDHKPQNASERVRIRKAGGYVSENRVDGNLNMSRAIGDYMFKENKKLSALEQKLISLPDITTIEAGENDTLVLFCDGLVET